MKLSQFKFNLKDEQIARFPSRYRDESRLLVVHKDSDKIEHLLFKDILNYFGEHDFFIFNDSRFSLLVYLAVRKKPVQKLRCSYCAS